MTQISQTIMKTETCLEIQAYVDGELDASRRTTVEHLCATDPEARQLSEGLAALRTAVRAHEPEFQVPETREFYWSQIQRRMSAASAAAPVTVAGSAWTQWMRWLVPLAGAAAVVSLLTLPSREGQTTATLASMSPTPKYAAPASSIVYRSDTDGVTVHWIN